MKLQFNFADKFNLHIVESCWLSPAYKLYSRNSEGNNNFSSKTAKLNYGAELFD